MISVVVRLKTSYTLSRIVIISVRSKFQSIESMSDLVSIIKAKWKNLEEFAMIAWLIWFQRNKLRINEVAMLSNKLAQSATTLLAEFQHGKKQQEPKQRVRLVRWQPPLVDTVKVNFNRAVFG